MRDEECVLNGNDVMTDAERQNWERTRAQGYDRFILRGIWPIGLPLGIGYIVVSQLVDLLRHRAPDPLWQIAIEAAFMVLVSGYLDAERRWRKAERDYCAPANEPGPANE